MAGGEEEAAKRRHPQGFLGQMGLVDQGAATGVAPFVGPIPQPVSVTYDDQPEEDVYGSVTSVDDPTNPLHTSVESGGDLGELGLGLGTGKAAKRDNSLEMTVSGAVPKDVRDAKYLADSVLVRAQQLQLEQRMVGYGMVADLQADLGDEMGEVKDETMAEVQRYMDEAEVQFNIAGDLVDAARGNRINPGQFFANVGDAGTFASSIAMASGYMAQASLGGVNLAGQIIDQAIARNVRSQEFNMQNDLDVAKGQLLFADKLRQLGIDRGNVGNLHQTMLIAMAQARLDSIKAATASAETRAQIDQLWAGLDAKHWEGISAFYSNIQSKFIMKYSSLRDGIQRAQAAVATANTAIESAGGVPVGATPVARQQAPAPSVGQQLTPGRPAASGRTGKRRAPTETSPTQGQAELTQEGVTAAEPSADAPQSKVPKWSSKQSKLQAIAAESTRYADNPRVLRKYLQQQLDEDPELGDFDPMALVSTAVARRLKGNDGTSRVRTILQGRKSIPVKTKEGFHYLSKENQDKAVRRVNARDVVLTHSKRLGSLIEEVGYTKWYNTGKKGHVLANLTQPERRQKVDEISNLYSDMANEIRTEGGSDAIRAVSEWNIWLKLVGATPLQAGASFKDLADKVERVAQNMIGTDGDRVIREWRESHKVLQLRLGSEKRQHFYSDSELYQPRGTGQKDAPDFLPTVDVTE